MKNPLENFKNHWDADGEIAQSFLNVEKVLNLSSNIVNKNESLPSSELPTKMKGGFIIDEAEAYKFMINITEKDGIEMSGYVTNRGVYVMPWYFNTNDGNIAQSYALDPYVINGYKSKMPVSIKTTPEGVKMYVSDLINWEGEEILLYAYVHTHPTAGPLSTADIVLANITLKNIAIYAISGISLKTTVNQPVHWYNPQSKRGGNFDRKHIIDKHYTIEIHAATTY